jgi:probable rRNA maturation factor
MNRVDIAAAEVPPPQWVPAAEQFILTTLSKIEKTNWDISILFCNDGYIQELNNAYRHKDKATDVLSFPAGETVNEDGEERYIPGDIVISLESLKRNAEEFGISEDEELRRLLVHGILHLDGMDHSVNSLDKAALQSEPMLQLQERIIRESDRNTINTISKGEYV